MLSQAPSVDFLKTPSLSGDYRHFYLKEEVYSTYLCRDKYVCTQRNRIQEQKLPIHFSCEYCVLTAKPFQKPYLSHIWKGLGYMVYDKFFVPTNNSFLINSLITLYFTPKDL